MSECSYDYKFYFSSPAHAEAAKKRVLQCERDNDVAESLGFSSCLDDESEYIDFVSVQPDFVQVSLSTSTTAELNHRLVRASKDIGSEFCVVDVFNDQVGEGWKHYLYRGRELSAQQRTELLKKYLPNEPVRQAVVENNIARLRSLVEQNMDVNLRISGRSLLEIAFQSRSLLAFKFLLKHKANVNIPAGDDASLLLHVAKHSEAEDSEYLHLLVHVGADLSVKDSTGASVLWYTWSVSQPLHRTLVKKNTPLFKPADAYASDNSLENLEQALEHGDHAKVAEFFKVCARDKSSWFKIAKKCYRYNYTHPVDVLIKNGFLQKNEPLETYSPLIWSSLGSAEVGGFTKLYNILRAKGVDLSEISEQILDELLAKNRAESVIEALIQHYPAALSVDAYYSAIQNNKPGYLALLLKHKKPFAAFEDEHDMPLLHYAIENLTVEMLEILISAGVKLTAKYEGQNILAFCIEDDSVDVAVKKCLLKRMSALSAEDAIFSYIKINDLDGFKENWVQLKEKSITDEAGNSPLMTACRQPKLNIAQFLLAQKINVSVTNEAGESALSIAVAGNRAPLVQALLKAGANPNALCGIESEDENEEDEGVNGFSELFSNKFEDALDSAQVVSKGATCLMYAASHGFDAVCGLLIKHGADIWLQDESKQDALIYAIVNNENACVDLFLKTSKSADQVKKNGASLMNMAAMGCNAYAINRLVKLGVSPNLQVDDDAITPLIIATILSDYTERYDAIDALLNAGADLGKTNSEGKTALIYACVENNQIAIAKFLAKGGYPDHIDKEAKTAYDHFLEHDTEASDFSLDKLVPKSKSVAVFKLLVHFRKFLLKRLIPLYVVLNIIALFSQSMAINALYLSIVIFAIKPLIMLKKKFGKPKPEKKNMMALGLSAIGRAFEQNQKRESSNQAIIDSWND